MATPAQNRRSRSPRPTAPSSSGKPESLTGNTLHRITEILAALNSGQPVTATTLARRLQVSRSTIMRDIETLRNTLGVELDYDPPKHTYRPTRSSPSLPLFRLDPHEAIALALAGRMAGGGADSPLGRMIRAMLRKVAPVFGGAVTLALDSVDQIISAPGTAGAAADEDMVFFFPLVEAILHRRVVRLDYTKPGAARPEKRLVHPLHITEYQKRFRLIAWDTARREVRNFRLSRIRAMESTGGFYEPPAGFDLAAYLRGSLGAFSGEKEFGVRIALDAHAAAYARDTPWHPSQQLKELPGGGAEITLRVNHATDVTIAVLRWGRHAEVLAPADLRKTVREELTATLARYRR